MEPSSVTKLPFTTGNPTVDGLIYRGLATAAASLTMIIVTWLSDHGFHTTLLPYLVSGAIFTTLVAGAGFAWAKLNSDVNMARYVQSGINLVVSGNALAADGKTVVSKNDGTTPPLPVTPATAQQIVKDFSPAPTASGKS